MSYNIEYNPELHVRYPAFRIKKRRISVTAVFAVLFCVITGWIIAKNELLRFLIPGDPEVTAEAFSTMVDRIENGVPVGEGLLAFCEEIITNAQ